MSSLQDVLVALRRVIRATDLHSRYLIKTTGLTTPQILLLQNINTHGEVTIGELSNEMSLSQATVTTILDRLESRALIYRERSKQDRRKVHARLTDQGQEALKNAPVPLQEQFAQRFDMLQDWERTLIVSALQRVAEMMDAQDLDASPILEVGALDSK